MAPHKTRRRAPESGNAPSNFEQLAEPLDFETTAIHHALQAARPIRKFGLTQPVARVVASLVFGEATR
jgi:hypothetical protein